MGAELAIHTPPDVAEGEVLDWLTAPKLEPPRTPAELVRAAVESQLPGAVDALGRLVTSATDEEVRLKAIKALLDLSVVLGVIEPGAGTLESLVRSLSSNGGVVAMIPPGRED